VFERGEGWDTWPWELPIPTALVLGLLYASVWVLSGGRNEKCNATTRAASPSHQTFCLVRCDRILGSRRDEAGKSSSETLNWRCSVVRELRWVVYADVAERVAM
jgi:hypothetical protein